MRILVSAVLAAIIPISVQAQTIAIRAGRAIDPETGAIGIHEVILVSDGKITAVGTDINVPADARIIDLSKETVLPGLFDAHTHLLSEVGFRRLLDHVDAAAPRVQGNPQSRARSRNA